MASSTCMASGALLVTAGSNGAVGGIVFCVSALMFYAVLYRSRLVPRWITVWGLAAVVPYLAAEFLALSKYLGNDLTTPHPEFRFPGLKPGDRWCLCASRFLQAVAEGCAPRVRLAATHQRALEIVALKLLQDHAD